MSRRRRTRTGATSVVLALGAMFLLDGCSYQAVPGIRQAEDGTIVIRAPECGSSATDPGGPTVELQRWDPDATEWVVIWRDAEPEPTALGEFVVDPVATGLERDQEYAVDVDGLGRPWFGWFELDELPSDGSYTTGTKGGFPNTAAGRADLDREVCARGGIDGASFLTGVGLLVAVVAVPLVVGAIVLVALLRWTRRTPAAPPRPF